MPITAVSLTSNPATAQAALAQGTSVFTVFQGQIWQVATNGITHAPDGEWILYLYLPSTTVLTTQLLPATTSQTFLMIT